MSSLDSLIYAGPIFQALFPIDCEVLVTNAEGTFIGISHAKTFSIKADIGSKAREGGAIQESLAVKKTVTRILPKEMYGDTVKSISYPIVEDGKVLGAIALFISLTNQQLLQDTAQTIAATSQEMTATSEELAATASTLFHTLNNLDSLGQSVMKEINKTDDILKFVSDVSANSNLLGLNAAIEAARAGEHGRGFAVVAEEIRKMAVNSSQAVKEIKGIINNIQAQSSKIIVGVGEASSLGEQQAAASQEISSAMEQLAQAASNVEKMSELL